MRALLLLLFAMALPVQASVPCDNDGIFNAGTAQDCPARMGNLEVTPTSTGGLVSWTAAGTGGSDTEWLAVTAAPVEDMCPPGCTDGAGNQLCSTVLERKICTARVQDETLLNSAGWAWHDAQGAGNGARSMTVSGLSPDTRYCGHVISKRADRGGIHGEVPTVCWTTASDGAEVATPTFSPSNGTFSTSVEVTLSTVTSGASIYYTLDGSTPDATDTLYTAPFTLTESTTVKAIGVKSGLTNSSVASKIYNEAAGEDLMGREGLYVVDCTSGSDTNTGAANSPWKTLSKLQAVSKASGADVAIIGGCSDQEIDIDWGSSAEDPIEFKAAYWHNSGAELYWYNEGPAPIDPEDLTSPRIDGSWHPPAYGGGKTCNAARKHSEQSSGDCEAAYPTGNYNVVPAVWYRGLIDIESPYVTVAGLRVIGSAWGLINVNVGAQGNDQPLTDIVIEDNVMLWAGKQPLLVVDANHVYLRGNRIAAGDACRAQQQFGGAQCYYNSTLMNYGSALRCGDSINTYCTAERNVLHDTYGEGLSITLGTRHIVRDNVTFRLISTNIHGNSTGDSIVENNIGFGNPHDGESFSEANDGKEGIGWGAEFTWADPLHAGASGDGNVVRNNLYAGGRSCIAIINVSDQAANGAHPDQGGVFYFNTCVVDDVSISDAPLAVRGNPAGVGSVVFESNLVNSQTYYCNDNGASGVVYGKNVTNLSAASVPDACESGSDVFNATFTMAITPDNWETRTPTWDEIEAAGGWTDWLATNGTTLWQQFRMGASDSGVGQGVDRRSTTHPTLTKSGWSGLIDDIEDVQMVSQCGNTYSETIGTYDFHCNTRGATSNAGALDVTQ